MDVRKVLAYALDREREGLEFFSAHAAKAQHASVQGVFKRLADEERGHIRYIERLIAGLDGKPLPAADPALEKRDAGFFSKRAVSEMLEQTTIESMVPELPVLRTAFLIERDLAEFYANWAPKAEGEARKALEQLAKWEQEHERLFKSLHDKVFAEYSGMPWGG